MGDRGLSTFPTDLRSTDLSASTFASDLRVSLLVAGGYYLGCLLGFSLRFPSSGIAFIWPPNAILLSALLLLHPRVWPMILGGTLIAHGVAHSLDGVPAATWLWQFLGNGLQAVLAASIVLPLSGQPLRFNTVRSVAVFIGGAALAAPAIASLVPAYAYLKMGWASDFWSGWGMRTLTNLMTTVTLVPPLIALFGPDRHVLSTLTFPRAAEFILLLLGLFAVDVAALALPLTTFGGLPPALYACMPFLAWAAARFGPPGLSICLLAIAYLCIVPPASSGVTVASALQMIIGIQMFVGIAISPLMFLSAALEESRHTRQTEEALYHSEAKNAAILRAIPDLMFVLTKDSDHRYLDFYSFSNSALFVAPDEFLGKRMRDVLPADLAQPFEKLFAEAIASGEPRVMEYSLSMSEGDRFYEARVVACEDDRLLSIVRDITERKRAEAAVQKAQRALTRMSRASALGELAASIAHEVQQPLNAISLNAAACLRWLEAGPTDSEPLAEALSQIVKDSQRAGDVIRRTRDLFSSGRRENVPVALNPAIAEVLALTRNRAERDGESVRAELDDGLVVMGDRVQLQQVLLNLLVNGLEAMSGVSGPNRVLIVRSWRKDGFGHVAVRDAGPGFDPSEIERIFDPFHTTKSEGLGIGLAISRSIIRAHGGTLQATLNEDGGATFEFTVPIAPGESGDASLDPPGAGRDDTPLPSTKGLS